MGALTASSADPSVAIPLQFSIDAAGLTAAVLVGVAWLLLGRRVGFVGAVALAISQVVFTAQLITPDDGLWHVWGVVRIVAVVAMLAPLSRRTEEWPLPAAGGFGMAAGGLWQTLAEQGPVELAPGARLLLVGGALALAAWAWRRSHGGVRVRILASLVVVLGIVVVVAGGAVLRVATTEALNSAEGDLADAALAQRDRQLTIAESFVSQAVTSSALLSASPDRGNTLRSLRTDVLRETVFALIVGPDGTVMGNEGGDLEPGEVPNLVSSDAVDAGLDGRAVTASIRIGGSPVVGVAPVYASASSRTPEDIVGALVLGERIDPGASRDVQVVRLLGTGRDVPDLRGEDLLTATAHLAYDVPPSETIVAVQPAATVLVGAASVSRALVGALLASALLSVVVALWIGDRLTRPILGAVESAEVVKSQFLDSLSHELRTPLTPIRGYTDLLRRERTAGRRAGYLNEIHGAAQRLDRIITLLVDVAAIQAGRVRVSPEAIDVRELFDEIASGWEDVATDHDFTVKVPKSIPKVSGEPGLVRRVLEELVDNAVKFSPDGGTVELRAARRGDEVELSVRDDGIGLEPEAVSSLSAAFVQADPGHTRRFGGLGLGLTYATGILDAHGTRLSVEATPGAGSRFAFTLPTAGMVTRMSDRASQA